MAHDTPHYRPMKSKIFAAMTLVPLIPFVAAFWVGFDLFYASVETATISQMQRIVEDHRQMIESYLAERQGDLAFVAESHDFADIRRPEVLCRVFSNLQNKSRAFVDLGVFDDAGLHVAYCGPYELEGRDYSEAPWFQEVSAKGLYVSDVFLGYRRVPHFVIALAKIDPDGRRWFLRATIDTLLFTEVVEKVRIGETGEAYIVNTDHVLQTRRRSGGNLLETAPQASRFPTTFDRVSAFVREDLSGRPYVYVTTWLDVEKPRARKLIFLPAPDASRTAADDARRWLLVVRQAKSDAFSALFTARLYVLAIAAVGGLIIVLTAWYVSNRIVAKIRRTDTEKAALNQQLVMAGRLAEIGEMSSGFAHEINNPLQIIRSEISLVETILDEMAGKGQWPGSPDTDEINDSLNQIKVQVERSAEITASILKFARKKDITVRTVDLAGFVGDVVHMVAKKAQVAGITIRQDNSDGNFCVSADPGELQQVLLNLLNNALHAVEKKHGTCGTGEVVIGLGAENGSVTLSITDNGTGIAPDDLPRIFTPFFSTKPVGQGTGLGLSICYGLVEKMGGSIVVKSTQGQGTTFTVKLPEA